MLHSLSSFVFSCDASTVGPWRKLRDDSRTRYCFGARFEAASSSLTLLSSLPPALQPVLLILSAANILTWLVVAVWWPAVGFVRNYKEL